MPATSNPFIRKATFFSLRSHSRFPIIGYPCYKAAWEKGSLAFFFFDSVVEAGRRKGLAYGVLGSSIHRVSCSTLV